MFIPWEKITESLPARKTAEKPGLYLSTNIGLDQRQDLYKLGVVFTVLAEKDGQWQTIFRRVVDRRCMGWERWDIPVPSKSAKLRFVTDSYSRAQDRSATTWNWALWGKPQLVEVASGGKRNVKYDFASHIDQSRAIVRLDSDGKERPFDAKFKDSTGATFTLAVAGPIERLKEGEGKSWQWVDGFADWADGPSNSAGYPSYLGTVNSGWAYSAKNQELSWFTSPVVERKETVVAFVAGTGYAPGKAELWCDGSKLVTFDMAKTSDMKWEENGVELRFLFGGDTRGENTPYGISGVYLLKIPASMVTPGKPLNLSVKMQPEQAGDWFMVHCYRSVSDCTRGAVTPKPTIPAIAAFTPHLGSAGVTIAEYDVDLGE